MVPSSISITDAFSRFHNAKCRQQPGDTSRSSISDIECFVTPSAKPIAGGGAVGVETAGEIAYNYGGKDMTILSGGTRLLPRLKHTGIAKSAEKQQIGRAHV